ncbi:MAG: hypothetical protein LBP59_15795 [Planctomycetaceae bacterium]|jgi:hypothetical protein|nr:hypothetical protein [Planctomycetaceae bacterium]
MKNFFSPPIKIFTIVFIFTFFAFCIFVNNIASAQNPYRKPSQNDIDWLLGNNKSKLPNRNTINLEQYNNNDDDDDNSNTTISQVAYLSQNNLPEPCTPITCTKNGSKLKNPNCKCQYCGAKNQNNIEPNDVKPCGKVNFKIDKTKLKQQPEQSIPNNSETENNMAQQTKIEFAAQKPITIETIDQENSNNDAEIKIAYPEQKTGHDHLTTPQTNTTNNKSPNAIALSLPSITPTPIPPAPHIPPAPTTPSATLSTAATHAATLAKQQKNNHNQPPRPIKHKQKIKIETDTNCDCNHAIDDYETTQQQNNIHKITCQKNIHDDICSCGNCERLGNYGSGEIIAETCIGVLFRQINQLRYARTIHNTKHKGQCNCWLCANLDNPDMIGNGILTTRITGFGNNNNIYNTIASPNMLASRPDITTHFNAETRNRFWADYRQFNNAAKNNILANKTVALSQNRTINLFTLGLEKRIGTQTSIEARIPLIYQYSSNAEFFDGNQNWQNLHKNNASELGNITLSSKYVFARTKRITLTTGLGVMLPTAEDWEIKNFNASINNKAYNFASYIAAQWHPNDSAFGHLLVQADIPINKNEITFNNQKTKIKESQIIQIGIQLGRWLYRNEYGMYSCRIGSFIELDYAIATNSAENKYLVDNNNNAFWINSTEKKPDRLNLTAGLPISFGQFSINNAVIIPLSNNCPFSIAYNFSMCRKF